MRRFPSKPNSAHHAEWLSLTETVGLFFAVDVLERVFPQGLDAVDTPQRQRLRVAYDEWRDAVDEQDPQLAALHQEWVRMVLEEGLEYDQSVLVSRERLGERFLPPQSGVPRSVARYTTDWRTHKHPAFTVCHQAEPHSCGSAQGGHTLKRRGCPTFSCCGTLKVYPGCIDLDQ